MSSEIAQLLHPRSVAMIAASEDQTKFGGRAFWMLIRHQFAGEIYPVNPRRAELFGRKAYPSVGATPSPANVAILAIPKPFLHGAIEECAAAGVKGAIIITSQFSETGEEGARAERALVAVDARALVG